MDRKQSARRESAPTLRAGFSLAESNYERSRHTLDPLSTAGGRSKKKRSEEASDDVDCSLYTLSFTVPELSFLLGNLRKLNSIHAVISTETEESEALASLERFHRCSKDECEPVEREAPIGGNEIDGVRLFVGKRCGTMHLCGRGGDLISPCAVDLKEFRVSGKKICRITGCESDFPDRCFYDLPPPSQSPANFSDEVSELFCKRFKANTHSALWASNFRPYFAKPSSALDQSAAHSNPRLLSASATPSHFGSPKDHSAAFDLNQPETRSNSKKRKRRANSNGFLGNLSYGKEMARIENDKGLHLVDSQGERILNPDTTTGVGSSSPPTNSKPLNRFKSYLNIKDAISPFNSASIHADTGRKFLPTGKSPVHSNTNSSAVGGPRTRANKARGPARKKTKTNKHDLKSPEDRRSYGAKSEHDAGFSSSTSNSVPSRFGLSERPPTSARNPRNNFVHSAGDKEAQSYFNSRSNVADLSDLFAKAKQNPLLGDKDTIREKSEQIIEALFYSEERRKITRIDIQNKQQRCIKELYQAYSASMSSLPRRETIGTSPEEKDFSNDDASDVVPLIKPGRPMIDFMDALSIVSKHYNPNHIKALRKMKSGLRDRACNEDADDGYDDVVSSYAGGGSNEKEKETRRTNDSEADPLSPTSPPAPFVFEVKATRVPENLDFIAFFSDLCWLQWNVICASPFGMDVGNRYAFNRRTEDGARQIQRPSANGFADGFQDFTVSYENCCLSVLYDLIVGLVIGDKLVIPRIDFVKTYVPPITDITKYGFKKKMLTRGVNQRTAAYKTMQSSDSFELLCKFDFSSRLSERQHRR
jgi:hypothetical protein